MKKKHMSPSKTETVAAEAINNEPEASVAQTDSGIDPEEGTRTAESVFKAKPKSRRDPDKRNTGAWVHRRLKETLTPAALKLSTTEASLVEASLVMTLLRVGVVNKQVVEGWMMDGTLSESASLTLQRLTRLFAIKDVKQMPVF